MGPLLSTLIQTYHTLPQSGYVLCATNAIQRGTEIKTVAKKMKAFVRIAFPSLHPPFDTLIDFFHSKSRLNNSYLSRAELVLLQFRCCFPFVLHSKNYFAILPDRGLEAKHFIPTNVYVSDPDSAICVGAR